MSVNRSEAWKVEDKGPEMLWVCWTMAGLTTVFVSARVWCRRRIGRTFYSDDYCCILSLACILASCAAATVAISYGYGRHKDVLTYEQKKGAIFWSHVGFAPGIMSFAIPKLAVVSLLTRLMNPRRYHLWFLWGITILCLLTHIVVPGLHFGRCVPVASIWDDHVLGRCFDPNITVDYSIYGGVLSAFVDVYLALYPTLVLFQLQMAMKRKIALSCALGVGAVGGAVAIVKSIRLPQLREDDFTYLTSDLQIRTVVEGSTITIASTIPVLQPLLELILRRNPFSTAKNTTEETPKFYEDYASQRGSRGGSKIELGQRKPRPKPRDDLGFTIIEDDSQENILPECKRPAPAFMSDRNETTPPQSADGGIVRTDVVCVSFEDRGTPGEKSASSKWDIV
ncbi:integral membrane protein [Colletotrichum gloeosporioides Cg-14]|uniref:Integral membrane protein n=1 Tax=Colletotrichum gloeosporioides (strain Cg-14) TaxID=1237896 RepID=T0KK02_COLGC|nr:integral membrane protein [Colletotrichum gloeosporioides Cg-14]